VVYIVNGDCTGLKAALEAPMPGVAWQRCQCHLQRNAMAYVPKVVMRKQVHDDIRGVFNAPDRHEAGRQLNVCIDRYRKFAAKLAE